MLFQDKASHGKATFLCLLLLKYVLYVRIWSKNIDGNLACHHKQCLFFHNCEVVDMVLTVGSKGAISIKIMNENSYLTIEIIYNNQK